MRLFDAVSEVQSGEEIGGRFELVERIGQGGQGATWRARDLDSGEEVAVKELTLSKAADWKSVELFEREGKVLAGLDHPRIPRYIDAFSEGVDASRRQLEGARFFIVQEYVDGLTLADLIDQGLCCDEQEALDIVEQVLEVLSYLHARQPPVVHRDIKPANLVRVDGGGVVLVDFGAVQAVLPGAVGGSTVVGTTGYLPPEQLMGRAVPASDLYALGATAVHLLSGRHPAEFDMVRNRLQYHDQVRVSAPVRGFLDRLLEPAAEDRFATAAEALERLGEVRAEQVASHAIARVDDNEHVSLDTRSDRMLLVVRGEPTERSAWWPVGVFGGAVLVLALPLPLPERMLVWLGWFCFAGLMWFHTRFRTRYLSLDDERYTVRENFRLVDSGPIDELRGVEASRDGRLLLRTKQGPVEVTDALSAEQARRLQARIGQHLARLRDHDQLPNLDR